MAFRKSKPWLRERPSAGTLQDFSHPLAQGLVGHWVCNDDGGDKLANIAKSSNNPVTLSGSYGFQPGKFGNALSFGGSGYGQSASAVGLITGTQARSVSFWFYQRSRVDGNIFNFVQIGNAGSGQTYGIGSSLVSGTTYLFSDGVNGGNNITITGADIPSLNQWHHLAFSYDPAFSNGWAYYLDGQLKQSGAFSPALNTNVADIQFGRRTDGVTGYLDGFMMDIRLYNRYLFPTDVQMLYSTPFADIITPKLKIRSQVAAVVGGSSIKTINGLALASVKSVNGLAIASVKTRNGLA